MSYPGTFIILTPIQIQMPQMPALIPIKTPQMLQTNTITVPSNNTTYSIKPASTSTTQTPITKFIAEKKASMPQRPSQPLYAPLPVEWPAHKPHNVARAEKREKLRAELTTNAQSSQPQPNPSLSYFSGLTAVQASKRGRPQSEDVTQEEQVAATEIKKHHHKKKLPFDTRTKYHAQLNNGEITEAYLEGKGFSYWQILSIKKAEPKRHKRLSFETRTEYHTKLNNSEITEADLKAEGLSYWQILAIKKTKPKRPKRLSFGTRTEYHAKLNNSEITEADLKDKGYSDWQISSLQKAEPKPYKPHKSHKPHKPLSLNTRTKYHA